MKKSILLLIVSTALSLPVFASGDHGHHHSGKPINMEDLQKNPIGATGLPVHASLAKKTIEVNLNDDMKIYFKEKLEDIKSGTVIQFIVTNTGDIAHEFSIGNQEEQRAHSEMMKKMPGMVHNDGNTVTVGPGGTKKLTWRFYGDDLIVFACNIPGHYEAGMFKKILLKP